MKMAVLYLFTILFFLQSNTLSQDFWEQTNGPGGNDVSSMIQDSDGTVFLTIPKFGLFKSTDLGQSWSQIKNAPGSWRISKIILNSVGDLILAADKIYISTNKGANWEESNIPAFGIYDLTITKSGALVASVNQIGIYRSTDNGYNWLNVTNHSIIPFSFAVAANGYLISGTYGGVYKSTDDGLSWNIAGLQNQFITEIVYSGNVLFVYASEHYRSSDHGENWELLTTPSAMSATYCSSSDSLGNVFFGSYKGVWKSSDLGDTWNIFAFPNYVITNISLIDGSLFVGTLSNSFWKTTDDGIMWHQVANGLTNTDVISLATSQQNSILVGSLRGFSISNDGGNNWIRNNNGLYYYQANGNFDWVHDILVLPNDNVLIAAFYGLYKSNLGMTPWQKIPATSNNGRMVGRSDNGIIVFDTGNEVIRSTNEGQSWELTSGIYPYTNFISASPGNTFFSGSQSGIVFRSSDGGANWAILDTSNGAPDGAKCIAYNDSGHIFIASSSIYMSTDEGLTWRSMEIRPQMIIHSLAINKKREIFAATTRFEIYVPFYEVYRSTDLGISFHEISGGLENHKVNKLAIDNYGFVYAGTDSNGVYKSVQSTVDVSDNVGAALDFELNQNYPNPFNPNTIIKYSVAAAGIVSLKIFDILGREVSTLVNEEKPAGRYEVNFNASHLASGVYFYQIKVYTPGRAGSFIQTKKMLLLK